MTRLLLLLAAAEPAGDPALLWRAAGNLGISAGCGRPGRGRRAAYCRRPGHLPPSAGPLCGLPGGVGRTTAARAHRALAEATDPGTDPDRRAWHRAQAAAGPDEDIAAELERSASRAQARGGSGCGGRLPGTGDRADAGAGAPGGAGAGRGAG